MKKYVYMKTTAALLASVCCQGTALAEEENDRSVGLEEIVVTAQLRSQSALKVPMAISAFSGAAIEKQGIYDMEGWTAAIPGVNFDQVAGGNATGVSLTIRGLYNSRSGSTRNGITAGTTGFYIDDSPVLSIDAKLFDVERLEILKGPQGTLYGASSMGGTVKVIQKKADTSELSARVEGGFSTVTGGAEGYSLNAMINMPIVKDKLAVRVAAYYRFDSGFVDWHQPSLITSERVRGCLLQSCEVPEFQRLKENVVTKRDVGDSQSSGGRLMMTFTPTEKLKILASVAYQSQNDEVDRSFDRNINQGFVQERFILGGRNQNFSMANFTVEYELPFANFFSHTSHYLTHSRSKTDFTSLLFAIFGGTEERNEDGSPGGDIPAAGWLESNYSNNIFSQEVRLTSNDYDLGSNKLSWVLGGFYLKENRDLVQVIYSPGFNTNAFEKTIYADEGIFQGFIQSPESFNLNKSIYGDATFSMGERDQFKISGGLRYASIEALHLRDNAGPPRFGGKAPGIPFILPAPSDRLSTSSYTPRLNISYDIDENKMAYISAAKGFRIGGETLPASIRWFEPNEEDGGRPDCVEALDLAGIPDPIPGEALLYDSDSVWNYEAGIKAKSTDGSFRGSASVFYIDWTGLQQGVSLAQFVDTCSGVFVTNAGAASVKGFDFDFVAMPIESVPLTVRGAIGYAKARITDSGGSAVTAGSRLPNASDWTGSFSVEYEMAPSDEYTLLLRGAANYVGDRIGNPVDQTNPFYDIPAYLVLNASLSLYTDDGWEATIYANNVLNTTVITAASAVPFEGNTNYVGLGRPRTVGVKVSKNF